jgi:hypothetical protein
VVRSGVEGDTLVSRHLAPGDLSSARTALGSANHISKVSSCLPICDCCAGDFGCNRTGAMFGVVLVIGRFNSIPCCC